MIDHHCTAHHLRDFTPDRFLMSSFADFARHDDPSTHGVFTMFAQGRGIQAERNIYLCSVAVFVGNRHCMLVCPLCFRRCSNASVSISTISRPMVRPWSHKVHFWVHFFVWACVVWVATHSITFVFRHIRYVHSKRSQRCRTFSLSLSRHNQDGHPVTGDVCSAIYFHATFQ